MQLRNPHQLKWCNLHLHTLFVGSCSDASELNCFKFNHEQNKFKVARVLLHLDSEGTDQLHIFIATQMLVPVSAVVWPCVLCF